MPLCSLCQSVDFNNLPWLPAHYEGYHSEWNNDTGLIAFLSLRLKEARKAGEDEDAGEFSQPLGLAHHQSIDELQAAAERCTICRLIERAVSKHLAARAQLQKDEVYTYYQKKRDKKGPDFRCFLTKRQDNSDGFLVVSPEVNDLGEVWILAAVGFCVEDDDALSAVIPGRVIQEDSANEKTLARAINFVRECNVKHIGGRCSVEDVKLPCRVLDVGDGSSSHLRLCEPQGQLGKYTALSHRWPKENQFVTTRSKLETYKEGISPENLPKTFQEAIAMTRRLGIRFIWIDSICICQDDSSDWERESAKMASIYSTAYLVLAATGAEEDSQGLFLRRSPPQYETIEYFKDGVRGILHLFSIPLDFSAAHPIAYCDLDKEPLARRGWTLQERILGSRVLHFASKQLFFECYTHTRSEDGFRMGGRVESIHEDSRPEYLRDKADPKPEYLEFRGPSSWYLILQRYCYRKLTKESDKLPALSGIARIIEEQIGDKYVAGLWRSTLLEGILWQAVGTRRNATSAPSEYRAPSWSWASIDGMAANMGLGKDTFFVNKEAEWVEIGTVVDCHVELKGENPYGEVKSGWLKLKAPIEPLEPSEVKEEDADELPHKRALRVKTRQGKAFGAYCMFDTLDDESAVKLSLFAIPLAYIDRNHGRAYQALIITPVEGQQDHYRRVGKIIFDEEALGKCDWMEDNTKLSTITLL